MKRKNTVFILRSNRLRIMALAKFKVALVQLAVGANKGDNLRKAAQYIKKAAENGAHIVALPECFNSPYGTNYFREYAEKIPGGETTTKLSEIAKENRIFVVGGSIPEIDGDKLYNTCTVWNPEGEMITKFRKIHLFDIDVPGKITFRESETLSPGSNLATFKTPFCQVGLGICYDMRFAELAQLYTEQGCQFLIYPGAFNMTTGPAHWELLQRARAVDNQLYVATVSPARDTNASYIAWGHSAVVSPWGEVIATTDEKESVVYADIDLDYLKQVREQIPISKQKRRDLYCVKSV